MKNKLTEFFSVFLLCIVFGFLVGLQLKSVHANSKVYNDNQLLRADELQAMLNTQVETNTKLSKELDEVKSQLSKYREEAANSSGLGKALAEQLQTAEITAGTTKVQGTGVIVTMKEDPTFKTSGKSTVNEDLYIIHDDDVLKVVNELRDAGAEAVSINGERLLATSEIRCSGSTISINNHRYSVPYVITAIGEPKTMEAALTMKHGVIESLAPWGVLVSVKKMDKVEVPAYAESIQYKYASPVTENSGS